MNTKFIFSFALGMLVLALPSCCWKTNSCNSCVTTEPTKTEQTAEVDVRKDEAIVKF